MNTCAGTSNSLQESAAVHPPNCAARGPCRASPGPSSHACTRSTRQCYIFCHLRGTTSPHTAGHCGCETFHDDDGLEMHDDGTCCVQAAKRAIGPLIQGRADGAARTAGCSADRSRPAAQQVQRICTMTLAGGVAGCVMWGLMLPIDSAKTRIQAAMCGTADDVALPTMMRRMWRQGRARSWWAGLLPTLLRAFPANAAQWTVWELSTGLLSGTGTSETQ